MKTENNMTVWSIIERLQRRLERQGMSAREADQAVAQALRLLAHCTTPSSPINITGPQKTSVRWLAGEFSKRLGKAPKITGAEAPTAWIVDTTEAQRLLGAPRVALEKMLDWVADWVARGGASLGKDTHFGTRDGKY